MPRPVTDNWWRKFFEEQDSLALSCFPGDRETAGQIRGMKRLLRLTKQDAIADICCGYGRHLIHLVRQGYRVTGLDVSQMMLQYAQAEAHRAGAKASVVRGDALQLPFIDGAFDVVMNLFNSFGYFLDDGQNLNVLRETARVLKPGGRFLLDTRNRRFLILYAPYCQPCMTPEGRELTVRCQYEQERSRLVSRWSLPEDPQAVVHEASIRLYGLDELRELFSAAGFEEMGVYGTYAGEAFSGHHRQLLYVARKRA